MKKDRREYFRERYRKRYKKTCVKKPDPVPHVLIQVPDKDVVWEHERELFNVVEKFGLELHFLIYSNSSSADIAPPGKCLIGKKCFVYHENRVKGYHIIKGVEKRSAFKCALSGRLFPPGWYMVRTGKFYELDLKISKIHFSDGNFTYCIDIG